MAGASIRSYSQLIRSNRNVRLMWLAQVVSELGDWFYAVAIYSLLLELTGSARSVAAATVAMVFPQVLVSPMAGVINDRLRRKQVMIAADLARFFIVGAMLFAQSADRIWMVYLLMTFETMMWAFFEPGRSSVMPNLCRNPQEVLVANGLGATTWAVNFFLGSALGGLVAALFGRNVVFVVNACSFLLSAWMITRTSFEEPHLEGQGPLRWRELFNFSPLTEGWRYIREHQNLKPILLIKGGVGLIGANWVLLPVLGEGTFRMAGYGLTESQAGMLSMSALMGARGVGSFIGPMLGSPFLSTQLSRLRWSITIGFSIASVGYLGLGLASSLPVAAFAVLVGHCGTSMNYVFSSTLVQTLSEDRFRGRVTSAEFALMMTSISISSYASGVAIDRGYAAQSVAFVVGCLMMLPIVFWLWTTKKWSELR
ncbi:MFS transporter [Bryobacter aggregatus]|uniref:MFS transporter n=1 Tax=Bryobacter aggregatus TaxID=360054 RepID=UPI0004E1B146|nr:MFS transporter [Bryobacter aggregatus]